MCEVPRNIAWERRCRQIVEEGGRTTNNLTDEDLNELKGCIELGFGFNQEHGQRLSTAIPALDLYFAVNRNKQLSTGSPTASSPASSGSARSLGSSSTLSSFGSPVSHSDSWKIFSPGDDPQQVKTKLRHWAQAVACSVLQSPLRGEMDFTNNKDTDQIENP
ncbi:hypothetical protein DH2020_002977 [Rehmannia glutinosa]|uniref:Uncharacterized protein n=1 Tax=Rehmannia glutinosa TaxID=99300 RepID=A0ABR0XVH8_REHGL